MQLDILPHPHYSKIVIFFPISVPFPICYSSPQPWFSLPIFTTWYSSPTDLINIGGGGIYTLLKQPMHWCWCGALGPLHWKIFKIQSNEFFNNFALFCIHTFVIRNIIIQWWPKFTKPANLGHQEDVWQKSKPILNSNSKNYLKLHISYRSGYRALNLGLIKIRIRKTTQKLQENPI